MATTVLLQAIEKKTYHFGHKTAAWTKVKERHSLLTKMERTYIMVRNMNGFPGNVSLFQDNAANDFLSFRSNPMASNVVR